MIPLKIRKRILNKLAQAVPGSPASPTSPTSPNAPTEPASTTAQAVQPPPSFNVVSGSWGWIPKVYNPDTVANLNTILGLLNTVMHYSSAGKFNLSKNQNNIGGLDPSGAGSPDGKNAVLLTQLIYNSFINKGLEIKPKPTAAQITSWCDEAINSQPLLNLSQLNPTGPAAQQMRLSDSLRQTIITSLNNIKRFNPVQVQPQQV